MFFGIQLKNNSPSSLKLDKTLKLSQAVLAPTKNANKEPVHVSVDYNGKQFILCVLGQDVTWQCPLDLVFASGSEIKLSVKGSGTVHLTGYEMSDSESDFDLSMSDSSSVEGHQDNEESSDEDAEPIEANMIKAKKAIANGTKRPAKLAKNEVEAANDDDSDESSDEDFVGEMGSDVDEDMMSDEDIMSDSEDPSDEEDEEDDDV